MGKKVEGGEVLPYGVEDVWGALAHNIGGTKFKLVSQDDAAHVMEVKTGISLRSWGEKLRIELAPEGSGTRVSVSSASRLKTTLIDYGKNNENVNAILGLVRRALA